MRLADGSRRTSGYDVAGSLQAAYREQSSNKEFAVLWLSAGVREQHRQQTAGTSEQAQFDAVGIASVDASLRQRLLTRYRGTRPAAVQPGLRAAVDDYLRTRDVVGLASVAELARAAGVERVVDVDSRRSYLLIGTGDDRWPAVASLTSRATGEARVSAPQAHNGGLHSFRANNERWLLIGGAGAE